MPQLGDIRSCWVKLQPHHILLLPQTWLLAHQWHQDDARKIDPLKSMDKAKYSFQALYTLTRRTPTQAMLTELSRQTSQPFQGKSVAAGLNSSCCYHLQSTAVP